MKNYEPIEQQNMQEAHSGALSFWLGAMIFIVVIACL